MRVTVTLLPLAIGVTIGSLVAVATLQWGRAFSVWQLFWWLFVSIALGITIFYLTCKVMPVSFDEDAKWYLVGTLGGLALLIVGISVSIVIITDRHTVSAPVPLYWPLPVGAWLLMIGEARDSRLEKNIRLRRWNQEDKARRKQQEGRQRWRDTPDLEKERWEDQFLEALHSVTAGEARQVKLINVWSHLPYKFWPEMLQDALRVWRERECIDVKSYSHLIDRDLTVFPVRAEWAEISLSLTAIGRDLCRRAKRRGVPISEEFYNLPREGRTGDRFYISEAHMSQYDQRGSQIGAAGDNSSASNFSFGGQLNLQTMSSTDTEDLQSALRTLRKRLADNLRTDSAIDIDSEEISVAEIGKAIGALSEAEEAISVKDNERVRSTLRPYGRWLASFAQGVGIELAAAAIRTILHLP